MTFLTDSMSSSHGLEICLRIPIRVKDDARISCHEIDTETAGPSRKEETEIGRVWGIEMVYSLSSLSCGYSSIESLEWQTSSLEVVAQNIEHPHHLRENQHPVTITTESLQ